MPYKEHPTFTPPANLDAQLWRYIDVTKLLSMLEANALHFARLNTFKDQGEAAFGPANVRSWPTAYGEAAAVIAPLLKQIPAWAGRQLSASCWHMSEYESAPMWSAYADRGLALRTSWRRLTESVTDDRDVYAGTIHYADYAEESVPEGVLFAPAMWKRRTFEHEREVRLMIQDVGFFDAQANGVEIATMYETTSVTPVAVDIPRMLAGITVSPLADPWVPELIQQVMTRYGFGDVPVKPSDLYDAPVM